MSSRVNPIILQITNIIAVVATLVVDALANILPINGVTTGEVADAYPNLFTPPGYVFAIWGVIYVLLAVFMVFQARPNQRGEQYLQDISFFHLLGAIGNTSWIFLFHYEQIVLAVIPIVVLLISLIIMYVRLGIGIRDVPRNQMLAVHLPVSVYLGWISLATIAGIASALNVLIPGIPIPTQVMLTVIMLVVALVLTLLMLFMRKDIAFGLVVIWASTGVVVKQLATYPLIGITAGVVAAVVTISIIIVALREAEIVSF
ncbi:MAG: tryptophan-rich sensory protein [Candidatus Lokiarchaeota archaeon]|nr:tryptophan-rich sensory protein [Candidatus Lokiarchaeota archaeon]